MNLHWVLVFTGAWGAEGADFTFYLFILFGEGTGAGGEILSEKNALRWQGFQIYGFVSFIMRYDICDKTMLLFQRHPVQR